MVYEKRIGKQEICRWQIRIAFDRLPRANVYALADMDTSTWAG